MNRKNITKIAKDIVATSTGIRDVEELLMHAKVSLQMEYSNNHNPETKNVIEILDDAYRISNEIEEKENRFNSIKREVINLLSDKLLYEPKAIHILQEIKKI